MAGKFALIIGNSHYEDSSLGRLSAPDVDVQGLEGVLKAPDVGHFDEVITLLNEDCASVRKAVARFYDQRQRDDLLLLYFSGHGVKDEQGHLYLALRDTETTLLAGTAIETAFVSGRMDRSFSKCQVLVLDCCHSGAFANGAKAARGVSVGTAEAFEGTGLGRVILTATDSTQYAWEGDQIIGEAQNSLFTHFLIEGLKTGAADRDGDGVVTVDELYDYVREQVVNTTPKQTPHKWTYQRQGEIVLAQNPVATRSTLPPEIEEGLNSNLLSLRLEAVRDLETLLRGHHVGRARAALAALKDLSLDDSRKVANAAVEALKDCDEEERRQRIRPHLTAARAAIERKQFVQALESLRRASKLDAQAEGLAELVRIAQEGQSDLQSELAEWASAQQNLSNAVAPATAALPVDHDSGRGQHKEIQPAKGAVRDAESPPAAEDRIEAHPSDIFISYAHEDRDKARALADVLTGRGWKVWWDRKIAPGESFDVVIERELGTCKCAIVLWSAHSVGATWVRNEARRAARRKVLVPILIDRVETPLEFENLQSADLTSWQAAAEHPEFEAVFERIQALSPIPDEGLARSAVESARRLFGDGRRQAALAILERFRPADVLVSRALTELRAQADRIQQENAETVLPTGAAQSRAARRQAAAAQRQREIVAEKDHIENLLARLELDAAESALTIADKKFERPAELHALRERLAALRGQAHEQLARNAVESARHEFDSGRHQTALRDLEQFRPTHDLITRALTELRAEAERIEQERAEATRRQAETERLDALLGQAQREQLAREAVEDARREFGDGRRREALASLEQFSPAHDLVSGALTELRAEADRIEREHSEAARREEEAAQRQRELGAEEARIDERLGSEARDATEQALATAEETLESFAELSPLRERLEANRPQASLDAHAAAEPHRPTRSRFTSRPVLTAVAALLALMVGMWLAGVWPGRAPGGPRDASQPQNQRGDRPAPVAVLSPPAGKPSIENAGASSQIQSGSQEPIPIEPAQPRPVAPPEIPVIPDTPAESPASKHPFPSGRLEEVRTQAVRLGQAGQREQALNAVVQGLQIDPRDSVLRNMLDSLLRDAQVGAARSRQEAKDLDAGDRAEKAFARGQVKEKEAVSLRGKGRLDAATRSFWVAADQFRAAAEESKRIGEKEEAAEQALIKSRENEPVAKPVPRAPLQPESKPYNSVLETEAVTQMLRRDEEAYASLRAEAVRKMYPSTLDELEKDFAAASSFILRVEIDGGFRFSKSESQSFELLASANGRVIQDVVKKSGVPVHSNRPVTILLEKTGNTWIITRIR